MYFKTMPLVALSLLTFVAPSLQTCATSLTPGAVCPKVGEGGCQTGGGFILICAKNAKGKPTWKNSAQCNVGGGAVCKCSDGFPICG